MKKFLSLVLALVMTMSLVTVSAGAKDFTDNSKINYEEAVEVMSTLGVVGGYTDGSFNPQGTLTRGAAAKIICNLILGTTTADALTADAAPYKDVPVNHTFAPYIAYCAKEGIISGYADGTFRPANTLTGYAFMKMLLGALGLQADKEGYTGANWSISVAKRALSKGVELDNGLKGDFNGTKAATREEACLYALNMLKACKFEYPNDQTVIVGNVSVSTSAKAEQTDDVYYETVFKNLKCEDNEKIVDDFGRPATKWTYKGEEIGTYAKTPDVTYSKNVKLADIYADLNMSSKDKTATLYENGLKTATGLVVSKDADKDADKLSKLGDKHAGNGSIIEVYRNDDNNHVDIIVISVYVGEVTNVKAATKTKDAYVVVDDKGSKVNLASGKSYKNTFDTEAFEEDDMVAFTYSASENKIESMYKLTTAEGELSKRAIGSSVTLGDTTYDYAKEVAFDMDNGDSDMTSKASYTVYLDANGYVLYVEETEEAVSSYALVKQLGTSFDGGKAKLVLADGTEKTVSTTKEYQTDPKKDNYIPEGAIVTYKVVDGEYKLTAKKDAVSLSDTSKFAITKKDSKIVTGGKNIYADSSTIFVVKKGSDDWKVYTGIKNVPNVSDATIVSYFCKSGNKATIVFVAATTVKSSSSDILFVAGQSRSDRIVDVDDNDYYEYNAVVNGQITTVKVDVTATAGGLENGAKPDGILFDDYDTDDELITKATATFSGDVSADKGTGVKKMSGEYSIKVDTAGTELLLTVASDAHIFYVDKDGKIESVELKSIRTDANDSVYYTTEDGEITNLFVVEVAD